MTRLPKLSRHSGRVRKEGSYFRPRRLTRGRDLLGPDSVGIRQSLVALGFSSLTAVVAGGFLAAMTGTLERYPGLLVLVPAAIGMRGNIFGALGSRLATSIHAGTFRMSRRSEALVTQNVLAAGVLSLVTAVMLALLAKVLSPIFGLDSVIAVSDLIVLSVVGALLSFLILIVVTLGLAARLEHDFLGSHPRACHRHQHLLALQAGRLLRRGAERLVRAGAPSTVCPQLSALNC